MKRFLLFLTLAIQVAFIHATNDSPFRIADQLILNEGVKVADAPTLKMAKASSEEEWVNIGTGEWTDGFLVWSETGEVASETLPVERNTVNPNVYRVLPFKEDDVYVDYVIIHCENPNKVYFESFAVNSDSGDPITFVQAVEEHDVTLENKYHYGTLNNNTIYNGLSNFCVYIDGQWRYAKDTSAKYMLKMPEGFDKPMSKPKESGLYMGLISFSDDVKVKPISILNENSYRSFKSYVDRMEMGTFTKLYSAVNRAIDELSAYTYPEDLTDVILVTFTDGNDKGSLKDSGFLYDKEYADFLTEKIANTTIQGVPLEAYSIGLMSKDVLDEDLFIYNLKSIASKDVTSDGISQKTEHVTTVNDIQGLENQLSKIYEKINLQINHRELTIVIPYVAHETKLAFTLDGISNDGQPDKDSKIWFEGIFNMINKTLENVVYHGFSSSTGSIIQLVDSKTKPDGLDIKISDCRNLDGSLLDIDKQNVDNWDYIASKNKYQHNEEIVKDTDVKIEDIKSSVAVMLALDSSKSLSISDKGDLFPTLKSTASSFILLLAGGKPQQNSVKPIIEEANDNFDLNDPTVEIYNLQGIRVSEPTTGLYILRKGKEVKKIFIK